MLPFTKQLINYVEDIDNKKFIDVKTFATTLEKNKTEAIENLRNEIHLIEENSRKFIEIITHRIKTVPGFVFRTIGNITFSCPIIQEPHQAVNHPYKPCCINGVNDWYFIAFPELRQILPVTNVESLLISLKDLRFTKLDENMFSRNYESLKLTNFAVFPFTANMWERLQRCEKKEWPEILHQMRINKFNERNIFPLNTTLFLRENAMKAKPSEMASQWALFVQLYFVLFLFAKVAPESHLSI